MIRIVKKTTFSDKHVAEDAEVHPPLCLKKCRPQLPHHWHTMQRIVMNGGFFLSKKKMMHPKMRSCERVVLGVSAVFQD